MSRLQTRLQELYEELGTWAAVAERYGLNRGLVYRYARGERTPGPALRRRILSRDPEFLDFIEATVIPFLKQRRPS